jgi:hypothetical protein
MTHADTPQTRASLDPLAAHDDGSPLPDGGEPQGSADPERPAMLGKRFAETIVAGTLIGLVLAIGGHAALVATWYGHVSAWSWFLVALGGIAVGGAVSLFLYGTATDRSDVGTEPHGRAAVSEEGEWRRTRRRRARRTSRPSR